MNVALIGFEHEENLSLRYLAAVVHHKGFDAEIFRLDLDPTDALLQRIVDAAPLVVGISVPFQMRATELLGLSEALRAKGYEGHIVIGGHFATFEYENILRAYPAIDSVVRHEGEDTFVELCTLVRDGAAVCAIAGLIVRGADGALQVGPKRKTPKLDTLPFPDRRGAPHDVLGVPAAPILGSRGCYADCSFCCIYAYAETSHGPRYRMRTPESIAREMHEEYHRRGVRLFVFHDDNFFLPYNPTNLTRYEKLADLLERHGLTDIGLVIKCRPNDIEPKLFEVLKRMGMIRAYVGIETNSDEGVVSLNRRITSDDNVRALRLLRELDVYCSFNVLIFDPEATLDGVEKNLAFMSEFADTPFNFCRAEVYAGTPLKELLEKEGRLRGTYLAWTYEMRDPRVELLFRIATTAFSARNFNSDGVANLNMGLRFDNEVMRRFYPQAWDPSWESRLRDLSRRIGEDSVRRMREALAFASAVPLNDHRAVNVFTLELARALSRTDLAFLSEIKRVRREMETRVQASGRYAPAQPVWAAETKRLSSSAGFEISSELLPRPSLPIVE